MPPEDFAPAGQSTAPAAAPTSAPAPAPAPAAAPPSLRETLENAFSAAEKAEKPAAGEKKPVFSQKTADPSPPPYLEPEKRVVEQPEATPGKKQAELQPQEQPNADQRSQGESESPESVTPAQAPRSWKPDARAKWDELAPEVRDEVVRRERDVLRSLGESAQARSFIKNFQQAVQPFAARYQQAGLDPIRTVVNLMQADHALANSPAPQKAKLMAKLIADYGVDIDMLDQAISGQGDPEAEPVSIVERMIEQRLAPIQQFVQGQNQQAQQAQQREMQVQQAEINRMAQDVQNFPFFDQVRQDMADIMALMTQRGVYISLPDAYNRAVQMNPQTAAAAQAHRQRQGAQDAHQAATRSLGASLSVSGAPQHLDRAVNPTDLRSTIAAAWANHTRQ